jgi:DNA-binding CsgD family transcriptional regulator
VAPEAVRSDIDALLRSLIGKLVAFSYEHEGGCAESIGEEQLLLDAEVGGVRLLAMRRGCPSPISLLSPREQEIARMVASGYPNKTIASVLEISSWTVASHLRRIFMKLRVSSRAAMVTRLSSSALSELSLSGADPNDQVFPREGSGKGKPRRISSMATIPRLLLPGQVAWQAEFIVNNLRQTDYQHAENIDVDRGIYDCDCNGFVGFVLERFAPDHYAMIPKEKDQPRPRAFKYYMFFNSLTPESSGGWHQIDFLQDARRGDIIAWRFPEIEVDRNTGHVLCAAEAPVADDSGIVTLRVYDSAAEPHFDDTRGNGAGEFETGVGSGFINFQVDDAGRPTAFQFAPSEGFTTLPIAIGRLEPLPATTRS